jgi:hypothetical protein
MSWRNLLQPDLILGNSILSLTPDILEKHNLKGLVLDVDETLVPMSMSQVTRELHQWIQQIKLHAVLWLVSNNISYCRIHRIAEALDLPYIHGARKPSRRRLRKAVKAMDMPVEQIGMVGDRFFTDVLAGNRLGMFTILVEPMVNPADAVRQNPIRNVEVWLSRCLGATVNL